MAKSLDKKHAKSLIIEGRNAGKSDKELYTELAEMYYDKKGIALLITGTAKPENIAKYKIYNNILLGLMGISILFKVWIVTTLTLATMQPWMMLLVLIVPLLTAYFMHEIYQYSGPIYRVCGILVIAGFLQTIGDAGSGIDIVINLVFAGSVAGLCFYLDSNLFPDYSPKNLSKDSNGDYIFF